MKEGTHYVSAKLQLQFSDKNQRVLVDGAHSAKAASTMAEKAFAQAVNKAAKSAGEDLSQFLLGDAL